MTGHLADLPELATIAETAALLGVHRRTLYQWRRYGGGPRWIRVGRLIRYDRTDVQQWAHLTRQVTAARVGA